MKKIVFTLALAVAGFVGANAQKMTFDKKNIDAKTKEIYINYGTIAKNADGTRTIEFVNKGDKPLIIASAKASCGCTTPDFSKDPILPGKKGKIVVKYNTGNVGAFTKTVEVNSNDATQPRLVIKIKGEVK